MLLVNRILNIMSFECSHLQEVHCYYIVKYRKHGKQQFITLSFMVTPWKVTNWYILKQTFLLFSYC